MLHRFWTLRFCVRSFQTYTLYSLLWRVGFMIRSTQRIKTRPIYTQPYVIFITKKSSIIEIYKQKEHTYRMINNMRESTGHTANNLTREYNFFFVFLLLLLQLAYELLPVWQNDFTIADVVVLVLDSLCFISLRTLFTYFRSG